MIEHLKWLSEQADAGRRVDTDELWTLLHHRLGENRPLTDRIWRAWVTRPEGVGRTPTFNPAYRVARCGDSAAHSPHVMEHGPDQPRNCPGTGGIR